MLKVCNLLAILSQRLAMMLHTLGHAAPVLFTNSAVCVSAAILWLTIGIANTVKN